MYRPRGYDLMVVYDYSTLDFDENQLSGYNEIKVIAWSMGVWAAAQVLQKKQRFHNHKYCYQRNIFSDR